jgi:hypothetical protein
VNKNWPNDPKIGCKSPFSSANFIENDFNLKEELEKFERTFEKAKVVELSILNNFFPKFHVF